MNRDAFEIRIEIIKGMEWKMSRTANGILHLLFIAFFLFLLFNKRISSEWQNSLQHMLHYRIARHTHTHSSQSEHL